MSRDDEAEFEPPVSVLEDLNIIIISSHETIESCGVV